MKVAISGAGVSGPTLAYWLLRAGCEPTLFEAASRLRAGGYMIDFWGVGFTVAERMGLLPQIRAAGYQLDDARYVDGHGRVIAKISAETMWRELGDRFVSLPRGDLAAILFRSIEGQVETRFGVTLEAIEARDEGVALTLSDGSRREFDLVVGADGLHSRVRDLAFGPEALFARPLGYYVAAFDADGYAPRDELAYVIHGLPGRQIARFALRDGRTMFLLVFAAERLGGDEPGSLPERKQALARVFAGAGWEWPQIASRLAETSELFFDRVSQISIDRWSQGRVALIGDAAAAVSLVAGEGAGLGMTGAYVLASELAASNDPVQALGRYEARVRRFIEAKQAAARSFAKAFTPRTALGVWLRNRAVSLMALPRAPALLVGPQMRDDFELPEFAAPRATLKRRAAGLS